MTAKGAQLPRAYLRMSPNLDQHPDPEGMVVLICTANRQPVRGRFRDRVVLSRALGANRLRRFIERGDVVQLPDGSWYAEGWDEWQEGDLTVGERQRRIRDRRRDTPVTQSRPSNGEVTPPALLAPLHKRSSPSEAIDERRGSTESTEGERDVKPVERRAPGSKGTRASGPVDPSPQPRLPDLLAPDGRGEAGPGHGITAAVTA